MELRIMFVDKDKFLLDIYRRFFSRYGFTVDCTDNQEKAKSLILKHKYAAIISDLHLTEDGDDKQGLDLADATRLTRPATAFFILAAHVTRELELKARASGVYMCLAKPKTLSSIREALVFAIAPNMCHNTLALVS